jgi:hypothetical protein
MRTVIPVSLCAAFAFAATLAAADKPHLVSQPRAGAIAADGKFDDWTGNLQPLGSALVSVQVVNDQEFLYLRLTASDAATRMQIMRLGFTVWFDPEGGTRRRFGVRYPVVERGDPGQGPGGFGGLGRGRGRRGAPEGNDGDRESPVDRVDILGPGKDDARSLTRDHLQGVDVAVRAEQGMLQYELKVPMVRTAEHPYAIDVAPGKTIGLGLETGKIQQRSLGEGRGGGFGGGGMGGRGGGGMGGRGGGGGGRRGGAESPRPQAAKPLKVWATVATAPAR